MNEDVKEDFDPFATSSSDDDVDLDDNISHIFEDSKSKFYELIKINDLNKETLIFYIQQAIKNKNEKEYNKHMINLHETILDEISYLSKKLKITFEILNKLKEKKCVQL